MKRNQAELNAAQIGTKQERGAFYRSVFSLVIPMALQNLINVAVSSADVVMLGRVGETALSGASLAGQVQFIMTLILFGLSSGAAVLTAQYWGKRDIRTIERVLGIAMRFALLVSAVFIAAVWIAPEPIMKIFTPEQPVVEEGVKYLKIISFSYIFTAFTQIYLNVMRSVERVMIATVVYLISLLLNISLNAVFIFGMLGCPAMGVSGAALATLIARLTEFAIVVVYSLCINRQVRFCFKDLFGRHRELFRDFLKYSLPVTANEMLWGVGVSVNSLVIGHMGQSAVAANSAAQVVRQLATVVSFGIANATAILIGKVIGAGREDLAEVYGRRFVRLTLAAGLLGACVVLAVRPAVLGVMNLGPEASGYLSFMMFVMSYFVFGQSYNTTIIVGVCRAGGDTKFGLLLDSTVMWGFSILLGVLGAFVFHWSVPVVYVLLMSDEVVKLPITTWRYFSKKWLRNVTRDEAAEA